jgi:uncharacterized membrane protein
MKKNIGIYIYIYIYIEIIFLILFIILLIGNRSIDMVTDVVWAFNSWQDHLSLILVAIFMRAVESTLFPPCFQTKRCL